MTRNIGRAFVIFLVLLFALILAAQKRGTEQIPLPPTSAASGRDMFHAYCADCHGRDGKGRGPLVAILKVEPPNLTTLAKRQGGAFPRERVYKTISGEAEMSPHGSAEMPVWGPVFRTMGKGGKREAELRIKNLTSYIASLQVD